MPKLTRLLFVLFLAFTPVLTLSSTLRAEPLQGLSVDVYSFDSSALPDRKAYALCESAWVSVPNVNHDWGGDVVAGCQNDFVLIHYYGYITLPVSGDVVFQSFADDGFWLSIGDETVIDDWWLKGCSGSSGVHQFESGVSQKFDAWFYEYGGGACNVLFSLTDEGWGVVPESAFTHNPVELPVVEPPIVEPPIVEPPVIDPPVIDPPIVEPPVIDPPIVEPPIVEPPIVEPPVVIPPVIVPPVIEPPVVKPPVVEPPVVVPPVVQPSVLDLDLSTIDPKQLSDSDLQLLTDDANNVLNNAEPGSKEYELALTQLLLVAQADDIVVSEDVANIPVLGATVVGLTNAFNALGNFGADMSPKARHKAKQEVVAAVIVTQIATTAVGLTVSAPTSIRRIK